MLVQALLASVAVVLPLVSAVACSCSSAKQVVPDAQVVLDVGFIVMSDDCLDRLDVEQDTNRFRKMVNESFCNDGNPPTPLNNSQVRGFLEKVRADRQCYLRMAPKTWVSDGKTAEVRCMNQLYCLTGFDIVKKGGQDVFHPRCNRVETGLSASIRPRIVDDRRAVRLHLQACFASVHSALHSKPLAEVPITPPVEIERVAMSQPIPILMFCEDSQLSRLYSTSELIVPDGGTALVGCWKQQKELIKAYTPLSRDEAPSTVRQPKIKNDGTGRNTEYILVMVKVRIASRKASKGKGVEDSSGNISK